MPGPPLTEKSSILELIEHGVSVGLGITQNWAAQNTRFDLAWVYSLLFSTCYPFLTSDLELSSSPLRQADAFQELTHWHWPQPILKSSSEVRVLMHSLRTIWLPLRVATS